MKTSSIFSFLFLFLCVSRISFAQTTTEVPKDTAQLYTYYVQLFKEKGTYELRNGMHKVIVTIRYQQDSMITRKCYEGMIRVENSRIVPPMLLKDDQSKVYKKNTNKVDMDSFKKYKIPVDTKVINGRSQTYVLENGQLADVFFIDSLKK